MPINVSALTFATKEEAENNFNASTQDHSLDGHRPGDIDDIIEENARLIREMAEQNGTGNCLDSTLMVTFSPTSKQFLSSLNFFYSCDWNGYI